MTQRYFFCHMQKTGGISLSRRLRAALGHEAVYPNDTDGPVPRRTISVPHLLERWTVRRDEIVVVCGHFPLCTRELLDGPFATFTVLRDPVERVLSGLRHQRRSSPTQAGKALEEIYNDRLLAALLFTDHMTRMLSLTLDELDPEGNGLYSNVDGGDGRLERAKEALVDLDVIGFQEDYDGFCDELERRYGWDLGEPARLNTSPDDHDDHAALRARIAEDNRNDVELVAFARQLVRERRT